MKVFNVALGVLIVASLFLSAIATSLLSGAIR